MSYKRLLRVLFLALFVTLFLGFSSDAKEANKVRILEGQITCLTGELHFAHIPTECQLSGHKVGFKDFKGTLYFILEDDKSAELFNYTKYNNKKLRITGEVKRGNYIKVEKYQLL